MYQTVSTGKWLRSPDVVWKWEKSWNPIDPTFISMMRMLLVYLLFIRFYFEASIWEEKMYQRYNLWLVYMMKLAFDREARFDLRNKVYQYSRIHSFGRSFESFEFIGTWQRVSVPIVYLYVRIRIFIHKKSLFFFVFIALTKNLISRNVDFSLVHMMPGAIIHRQPGIVGWIRVATENLAPVCCTLPLVPYVCIRAC